MTAGAPRTRFVAFGAFRFDMDGARLFDEHGTLVPGPAKAFETLRALLQHRDRIVSKDELLALVWPDTIVEEANLAQQIFTLRRLLGDEAGRPAFIATLPRRGYRFVGDVTQIEEAASEASGSAAPLRTPRATRAPRAVAALLASLAIVAATAAVRWSMHAATEPRAVAFDLDLPPGVEPLPDLGLAGVSPDGRNIALIAQRSGEAPAIWVRDIAAGSARPLAGTSRARMPFWSPDGRRLGFFQESRLRVVAIDGGAPRDVCAAQSPRGGTWNAEGTIVFAAATRGGLSAVPAAGGTPVPVTRLDPSRRDVSHRYPSFLSDGRHFVFLVWAGDVERQGVYLGSLDGGPPVRLLADLSPAVWAAGQLLFIRRETLVAQPMQGTALTGEPEVVMAGIGRDPSDYAAISASPSGDLVVQRGETRTQLVWFDRSGRQTGDFGAPAHWADPAISRDGTRAAFIYRDRAAGGENLDVWTETLAPRVRTRITLDPAIDVLPVWSPDGREILFRSNRTGFSDLYRKRLVTTAPETLVLSSATHKDPSDWSPDGTAIVYTERLTSGPSAIWLHDLSGRAADRPLVKERAGAENARFSPDGRYIAFDAALTGRSEVYVQAVAPGGPRWRISTDGGTEPAWRGDGRELFFVASGRTITAVDVTPGSQGLDFGSPHRLFDAAVFAWLRNGMAVSPDGQRFLLSVEVPEPRSTHVVLGWHGQSLESR